MQDIRHSSLQRRTEISVALPPQATALPNRPASVPPAASTTADQMMTTTVVSWQTLPATTVFIQPPPPFLTPILSSTLGNQVNPTQTPDPQQPQSHHGQDNNNNNNDNNGDNDSNKNKNGNNNGNGNNNNQQNNPSGISDGSEDVLIAFGSIGATILIIFLIYAFYKTRRGVRFNELLDFKHLRRRGKSKKVPLEKSEDSMSRPEEGRVWNAANTFATATIEKVGMRKGPQKPKMVMIRANSDQTSPKAQPQEMPDEKPTTVPLAERSFLDQASVPSKERSTPTIPNRPLKSYHKPHIPSSSNPAINSISPSESRDTRDRTMNSTSSPFVTPNPALSAPPQLPTPVGQDNYRFTWPENGIQEPATPRFALQRNSAINSDRSSAARFRKIDSWVSNQTGRVNSALLRSQRGDVTDDRSSSSSEKPRAKVWRGVVKAREQGAEDRESLVGPPAYEERQEREEVEEQPVGAHARQASDATAFGQHPGVQVPMPSLGVMKSVDVDVQYQSWAEK